MNEVIELVGITTTGHRKKLKLEADVLRGLAIHHPHPEAQLEDAKLWVITHVASGLRVCFVNTKRIGVKVRTRLLERVDWTQASVVGQITAAEVEDIITTVENQAQGIA